MVAKDFGARIRELRQEREWTLKDIADELDLTPAAIAHWEKGTTQPRAESLEGLARMFGMSVGELTGSEVETSRSRSAISEHAAIEGVLAEAEQRIAEIKGCSPRQITANYTFSRK